MKLRHYDGFAVLLVIFLFLSAMAAQGQAVGSSVQPVTGPTYSVPDHPQHASFAPMRSETSLLGSTVTVASGERPMSDFPVDLPYVAPLGTVAREYREEKFATRGHSGCGRNKKYSHVYWEQQGSGK